MEAGVQPGPMYAKLQHGNAVTLTNGKTVSPFFLTMQFISLAGLNRYKSGVVLHRTRDNFYEPLNPQVVWNNLLFGL
jgi:hypothetical protein